MHRYVIFASQQASASVERTLLLSAEDDDGSGVRARREEQRIAETGRIYEEDESIAQT